MKIRILGHEIDPKVIGLEATLSLFAIGMTAEHKVEAQAAQNIIKALTDVITKMNPDTERLDKLRRACGYIENGTSGSVTLSQDDATKDWIVSAGLDRGAKARARVLAAIIRALKDEDPS